MQLSNILLSALALVPYATANFHLVHGVDGYGRGSRDYFTMAMPSNHYGCATVWEANDHGRRATVRDPDGRFGNSPEDFFSVEEGLCGQGRLDFYRDGEEYGVYRSGGDGREVARCFSNRGQETACAPQQSNPCGRCNWGWFYTRLVCYGEVCG